MTLPVQRNYLERVFSRSCLESAPLSLRQRRADFSVATRAGDRMHSQLHQLKQKLLHAALEEASEAGLYKRICGAANHAAELVWDTPCPLLVFPGLFEELVQAAREQFGAVDELRMTEPGTAFEGSGGR